MGLFRTLIIKASSWVVCTHLERGCPKRFSWSCPSAFCHWKPNLENFESQRSCSRSSRRFVPSLKKAVAMRKHLERNRKDTDSKFRLILVESRIHRLARYYKSKSVLPPNWKYESATASALVA